MHRPVDEIPCAPRPSGPADMRGGLMSAPLACGFEINRPIGRSRGEVSPPLMRKECAMFHKIHIRKHERGLLFRKGDFHKLLAPGSHYVWHGLFTANRVEIADTLKVRFEHPLLESLLREPELRSALLVVDLTDTERALVWKDARLFAILGPGRHAFW